MRALMKVASFTIATLFIPPHPTNLVIIVRYEPASLRPRLCD